MTQRAHQSLIETITSTAIGFGVSQVAQAVVFPWFGIIIGIGKSVEVNLVFMIISVIRGYAVRRLFNHVGSK